ncbi:MAG: TetR/AcrR family transcriptional regulator [Solirubrobacteraceae bacterium]
MPASSARDAILAATERLLRERRLSELSVSEIIAAAGISRTSFYAYFSSKTAVVAEALRRVTDQVIVAVEPFLSDSADDPEQAIRVSLERWVEVCTVHGALMRTVSEEWPHDEQLRALWSEILATYAAGTARVIRAARASGQAPPGADSDTLAACLMWGYERVLHLALVGDARGLAEPAKIVEPLAQLMIGSVFGRPPRTDRPPRADRVSPSPSPRR